MKRINWLNYLPVLLVAIATIPLTLAPNHPVASAPRLQAAGNNYNRYMSLGYRATARRDYRNALVNFRKALQARPSDRVIIYSLDPDYHAKTVVGESVGSGWSPTLKLTIDDPCLDRVRTDSYRYGYVRAVNDIYQEPTLNECHIKLLEQFGVKAKLVAPILNNDRLFGLLIAHQCYQPRNWEKAEIDLFAQLASQVGFALSQLSLFGKI
jgi:GAF domain-containing protein